MRQWQESPTEPTVVRVRVLRRCRVCGNMRPFVKRNGCARCRCAEALGADLYRDIMAEVAR